YLGIFMKATGEFEITTADIHPFITIIGMETIEDAYSILATYKLVKTPEKIPGLNYYIENKTIDYLRQKMLSVLETAKYNIRRIEDLDGLHVKFPKILGLDKEKLSKGSVTI